MKCPTCIGGIVLVMRRGQYTPCPDCGGSGFVHCCEGERPQVETCVIGLVALPAIPAVSDEELARFILNPEKW